MGHMAIWKTLEEMIIDFRKKGVEVPPNVMNDLRAVKSMILMGASQGERGEAMAKVEEILGGVEAYLITEAQKIFAPQVVDAWLRRIETSSYPSCEPCEIIKEQENKFITGVPRDQKWIRIEPGSHLQPEKIRQMAQEQNLQTKTEKNGRLTIYGKPENIKQFIKNIAIEKNKKVV
jgi:hypothetical protein